MIVASTRVQHKTLMEMLVMSHTVGKEASVSTAKSSSEWKTQRHTTEETEAEGFCSFRWSFSVSKKNRLPKSLIQATGNFLLDNNTSSVGKNKKGGGGLSCSWKWQCKSITQNSGVSTRTQNGSVQVWKGTNYGKQLQ